MNVALTGRFINSYFSGSYPQIVCFLARTLAAAGHTVTIIHPPGEQSWFFDVKEYACKVPPRKAWMPDQHYDILIEVVWALKPEDRPNAADRVIQFFHYPPLFHDMESSVYMFNGNTRSFKGISGIWTFDI